MMKNGITFCTRVPCTLILFYPLLIIIRVCHLSYPGRELSLAQQYTGVGILSLPVFWLAGAGSVIFWLIGASVVVILLHASMYKLDDEAEAVDLEMDALV